MIDHPDDVTSPFVWLDDDGWWNDFLSLVFAGAAWPEGSENGVWDLAQEWGAFADDLSGAAEGVQSAAADLLAAWDAPAAAGFDDLARKLMGSPDVGVPGHLRNAVAIAQQASGFGVDLQYAKVSVNVAVAVAAMAVVLSIVLAVAGGLSLVTLGPIASIARQAVIAALEKLATAAGRRAVIEEVGRAVLDHTVAVAGRSTAHSAGHHLTHEVVEEVLEELVIDVTSQAWQVSHGSRTDWNGLYTLQAAIGGGVGGAVGAGAVAPVAARLRRTPRLTALAGRGAGGGRPARWGNVGIRHTGGLVATASTNVVASPAGGIAASLLTGQGFPALDWSDLGAAALGAVGRYGTVSATNPAVLSAAVHPVQTLGKLHADALAGHTAQRAAEALRLGVPPGTAAPSDALRTTGSSADGSSHPTAAPTTGARTAMASLHVGDVSGAPTRPVGPALSPTSEPLSGWGPHAANPSPADPSAPHPDVPHSLPSEPAADAPGVGPASASPAVGSPSSGPGSTVPGHAGRDGGAMSRSTSATDPSRSSLAGSEASSVQTASGTVSASDPGPVDPPPSDGSPAAEQVGSGGAQDTVTPPAATGPAGHDTDQEVPGGHHDRGTEGVRGTGAGRPDLGAGDDTGRRLGGAPWIDGEHTGGGDHHGPDRGGHLPGSGHGPSGPDQQPPADPPTTEQELLDGMPEPLRRYLVEAVAHGQVWADLVQVQLGDVVQHLVEQGLPAPEAVGLAHAVKGLGSAARKIQPSIQGGSTFASAIWSMDDLVRFSLQIEPERYGDSVLKALDRFRALGWSVPAVPGPGETHDDWRNTWATGNRHHGLLVVLTHAHTGQRVEMQFPTPQSWVVGKQTHTLYEVMRVRTNGSFDRIVALARIRDLVLAEEVELTPPSGLDRLGPSKPNGPRKIFHAEPRLAFEFLEEADDVGETPAAALVGQGITPQTAQEIVEAAEKVLRAAPAARKGRTHDKPSAPGLEVLESGPSAAPSSVGELRDGHQGGGLAGPSGLPAPPRGPGSGASGPVGQESRREARAGEGLRLPSRDMAKAGDAADPGDPLGGGRGTGDGPVRRPQPHLDLGPGERQRDRAPGGRGPVRPAGAGHPGAGGGTGPAEANDPAEPGTPPGDVPQPGGQRAGHVGDPGGPGEAAQPAALTSPLAVGADVASALQYVLDRTDPPVMWEGVDGVLPGRVVLLADGSTVRINTGPNPWARTDPERPLQMWTVGSFHLDDGPLTPAASAFLGDLLTALEEPGAGLLGPASHWLAQRATLDPTTHEVTGPGVAEPRVEGARTLVWDAAQGWVDARLAGSLARAVDDVLIPAHLFANGPAAEQVVGGADRVLDLINRTGQAEDISSDAQHDAAFTDRARLRAQLRWAAGEWVAGSVAQTVAEFVGGRAQVVAESNGRLLVRLHRDQLAVAVVAHAENDALGGSRPGLQQEGTTTDIGQLRNELAASPDTAAWAWVLTRQLQQGLVRHVRVQGVLASGEFVGMRVTEFEVTQPPHNQPGAPRAGLEPHRYVDPGLAVREVMTRAVAGWTPSSVTDAIDNALRWLPHVNPLHSRFPVTDRMPWSNNCGDCSRAVADLVQGRDARAAFGDNGARAIDSYRWWGTGPGELREMWRWAGVTPTFRTVDPTSTTQANALIGEVLAAQPEGTVAIVLVNWADEQGAADRGHWFNAAVTERGVEWIDGQTAEHAAWPPPYTKPYFGYSVITRAQGSDTWVDLFSAWSSALAGPFAPFVSGAIASALAGAAQPSPDRPVGEPRRSFGIWPLGPADAAYAARIANYSGDWPEDEERREPASRCSTAPG